MNWQNRRIMLVENESREEILAKISEKFDLPSRTLDDDYTTTTSPNWIRIERSAPAGSELFNKPAFMEIGSLDA